MNARCYTVVPVFCMILSGCMFKPVNVTTRHFTLAPISAGEEGAAASAGAERLSIGISYVKMPSYLLHNSMVVRNGASELDYLEDALWSERLDEAFQRDVAANLANLLPSDSIYLTDWAHNQVTVAVYIDIQQFDVDTSGRGILVAQWRIGAPGRDAPFKSGRTHLEQNGASPRGKPEVIANTLSELAAKFSRELAQSVRESEKL